MGKATDGWLFDFSGDGQPCSERLPEYMQPGFAHALAVIRRGGSRHPTDVINLIEG